MWSRDSRARHFRGGLRYQSDLSDEEWAVIAPMIPPGRRGAGGAASILGRFSTARSTFRKPAANGDTWTLRKTGGVEG